MRQTPRSQAPSWRLSHRRAFRVAKAKYADSVEVLLSGDGAREWGGRFNSPGTRAVYCSTTLSLAALEILVHAPRLDILPEYRFLKINVPDQAIEHLDRTDAGGDTVALGDRRLGAEGILGFSAPSFVLPFERNLVLNPEHRDFRRLVTHGTIQPFPLDPRLLAR